MTALDFLRRRARDFSFSAEKALGIADKLTDNYSTAEELIGSEYWQKASARLEFAILSAFEAMAHAEGMPTGGYTSLGDTIMIQQAHRIEDFGEKAYRLSDKQVAAVIREVFPWIFAA